VSAEARLVNLEIRPDLTQLSERFGPVQAERMRRVKLVGIEWISGLSQQLPPRLLVAVVVPVFDKAGRVRILVGLGGRRVLLRGVV